MEGAICQYEICHPLCSFGMQPGVGLSSAEVYRPVGVCIQVVLCGVCWFYCAPLQPLLNYPEILIFTFKNDVMFSLYFDVVQSDPFLI